MTEATHTTMFKIMNNSETSFKKCAHKYSLDLI